MLKSVGESFDHIAEFVPLTVVAASAAIAARWDDRLGACRANLFAQRIAVISLVGNHMLGFEAFQQDFGTGHIVALPFGRMQLDRLALAIDRDVDFSTEAPTNAELRTGWINESRL
jgi:hypothetical protein